MTAAFSPRACVVALLCVAGTAACTGTVGDHHPSEQTSDKAGNGPLPPFDPMGSALPAVNSKACRDPSVEQSPLRRLTRDEYNHAVAELLGDKSRPGDRFVAESAQLGFTNGAASSLLSPAVVEDFETAAGALAKTAVASMATLLGCEPVASGEDKCAGDFIARFGARAFRRPLEADQLADYQALYKSTKVESGFVSAIELVVKAMLQSPYFLYRIEFGIPDGGTADAIRLSPHETAGRLANLFWGSLPDTELVQAASQGKLTTADEVRRQAERLLKDPRGARALSDFHAQWGQLDTLPSHHKNDKSFTPDVGRQLLQETNQFVDGTLRTGDGLLVTLLTSSVSYLNKDLAAYYGVSGPRGAAFERFSFPRAQRAGLLTQGSFMANLAHGAQPSPVLRGKFVLEQLLCDPPPAPPDNADTSLPVPDPNKTAREQLMQLTGGTPCVSCHALLNPPGLAFEHFDALGKYRDKDNGKTIDASGSLLGPDDANGPFKDHEDLMRLLSKSEAVGSCLVNKWFVYAHGRAPGANDACSLSEMRESFRASGGNVRELLLTLTKTPAFLYRRNPKGAMP